MTAGSAVLPEGQELTPRRRWWRRVTYLPLVLLALCTVAALLVGMITRAQLEQRAGATAPVASVPATSASDAQCRPPVSAPVAEPWIDDPSGATRIWDEHAAEVAEPYLVGPEGWIFWSDQIDRYASQAVGRDLLGELQMEQWREHLESLRDGLAADGVDFYVIVAPSTSTIYPEQLPEWMQSLRGSTIMDQFIAGTAGLPIIDLRADLIAQKSDDVNLFSWSNSHWTDYGAYASWSQIVACANALYPDAPSLTVPAVAGFDVVGDFNEWASYGVASPGADWAVPVYADTLPDVTRTLADGSTETVAGSTTTDAGVLPVSTSTPGATTDQKALIFRDSMGGGLSSLWQQSFAETEQIWHRYRAGYSDPVSYREYVQQYDPDVVILQLAERHLLNTPPANSGY